MRHSGMEFVQRPQHHGFIIVLGKGIVVPAILLPNVLDDNDTGRTSSQWVLGDLHVEQQGAEGSKVPGPLVHHMGLLVSVQPLGPDFDGHVLAELPVAGNELHQVATHRGEQALRALHSPPRVPRAVHRRPLRGAALEAHLPGLRGRGGGRGCAVHPGVLLARAADGAAGGVVQILIQVLRQHARQLCRLPLHLLESRILPDGQWQVSRSHGVFSKAISDVRPYLHHGRRGLPAAQHAVDHRGVLEGHQIAVAQANVLLRPQHLGVDHDVEVPDLRVVRRPHDVEGAVHRPEAAPRLRVRREQRLGEGVLVGLHPHALAIPDGMHRIDTPLEGDHDKVVLVVGAGPEVQQQRGLPGHVERLPDLRSLQGAVHQGLLQQGQALLELHPLRDVQELPHEQALASEARLRLLPRLLLPLVLQLLHQGDHLLLQGGHLHPDLPSLRIEARGPGGELSFKLGHRGSRHLQLLREQGALPAQRGQHRRGAGQPGEDP
mmetsp:Transcript_55981/g.149297  ORF Transcript_55981/g.149297 Transcript_55981/m.149297 type:complete len:491 (-) Transcript_55981:38-1510(-)